MKRGELQCLAFVYNYTGSIELLLKKMPDKPLKTLKTDLKDRHKIMKYAHDSTNLPALGIFPVQI